MNWKVLPLIIAILLTILNLYFQQKKGHFSEIVGWLIAGMWFFWIAYAYFKNKDLPMVGSFGYGSGSNQVGRAMATYSMLCLYAAAIFWS